MNFPVIPYCFVDMAKGKERDRCNAKDEDDELDEMSCEILACSRPTGIDMRLELQAFATSKHRSLIPFRSFFLSSYSQPFPSHRADL